MADRAFLLHLGAIAAAVRTCVRFDRRRGAGARFAPLRRTSGPGNAGSQLTEVGRKILAGQADNVRLYGIDRWLGGVHLQGSHAAWRWDDRRGAVIALSA